MTIPSTEKPIIRFQIRPLLNERVKLYTYATAMRQRIVEKTILKATSDPSMLVDDLIDEALFRLMHETAVLELGIKDAEVQPAPAGHQHWQNQDRN